MLEDLVETVLAGALEGVADQGWRPAEENAPEAFFGVDCAPGLDVGAVEFGVNLATAFHLQPGELAMAEGPWRALGRDGFAGFGLQWYCRGDKLGLSGAMTSALRSLTRSRGVTAIKASAAIRS